MHPFFPPGLIRCRAAPYVKEIPSPFNNSPGFSFTPLGTLEFELVNLFSWALALFFFFLCRIFPPPPFFTGEVAFWLSLFLDSLALSFITNRAALFFGGQGHGFRRIARSREPFFFFCDRVLCCPFRKLWTNCLLRSPGDVTLGFVPHPSQQI